MAENTEQVEVEQPEAEAPEAEAPEVETPEQQASEDDRLGRLEAAIGGVLSRLDSMGGQVPQRPQGPSEADRVNLELMDPTERAIHELRMEMRSIGGVVRDTQTRAQDQLDYNDFHSKASSGKHPAHAKYARQVEQMIADARRQGKNPPPREILLYTLAGKEVVNRASTKTGKGPAVRPASAETQGVRPPARGDGQIPQGRGTPRDEKAARAARLKNMIV